MSIGKAIVGGVIGGVIGAAAWAAVGYFTNRELGLLAWGVGGLVGLGVRLGARDNLGLVPGLAAAAIAVAAILAGKFVMIEVVFRQVESAAADAGKPMVVTMPTDDEMIASFADAIAEEKEAAGQTLPWPEGMSLDEAMEEPDYPPGLWKDAKVRWDALPPADRETRRVQAFEYYKAEWASMRSASRSEGFIDTFSLWDLIWFGLATMTAFSMGARDGNGGGDD